jgi:hypothetical protein
MAVAVLLAVAIFNWSTAPIDGAAERKRVVAAADQYLKEAPVTVRNFFIRQPLLWFD